MDTGTHLVIGLGLAGLSQIDPFVSSSVSVSAAVMLGTVLGSQAPDADTLLRFRGNALYIKNHRGTSHSLPAIAIWTILITVLISLLFGNMPVLHLGLWVLAAVCFHVFTDLFNTYGTQAAKPFSSQWISWNIIHIFDPFIFFSHLLAIFLWAIHAAPPQFIFPVLYSLIALYYVWRTVHHFLLEQRMKIKDMDYQLGDKFYLIPTINLNVWNVVKRRHDGTFVIGELKYDSLRWLDRVSCACHPAVDASRSHPDIAAFLYFSSFACAEVKELPTGYEVRWADIRYRHRKQYPFIAVLRMDEKYTPLYSYVGWKSESRLEKKISANSI